MVQLRNIAVPAGFVLQAVHHIDVLNSCELVGAFDVCITSAGDLAAVKSCQAVTASPSTKASGSLPRTGWDHLFEILRVAFVALVAGVFLLYLRRRAAARTAS